MLSKEVIQLAVSVVRDKHFRMKFFYIFLVLIGLGQVSFSQTYQDYYNRGLKKGTKEDYVGAILEYNKSIALNPKFSKTYYS